MNCPRCGGNMAEQERDVLSKNPDGTLTVKGKAHVWFCRDCKTTAEKKK